MYGHNREILLILSYLGFMRRKEVNITIIGAVYHPPKPLYRPTVLLECIESAIDALYSLHDSRRIFQQPRLSYLATLTHLKTQEVHSIPLLIGRRVAPAC